MKIIILAVIAALPFFVSPLDQPKPEPPPPKVELPTIYEIAASVTGVPASILRGIAITESNEDDTAIGDDGISIGRFQINERFHTERERRWGKYDPHKALQAAILAGFIYMDNLAQLGSVELALCAYRQGITGVRRDGAKLWYAKRVLRACK